MPAILYCTGALCTTNVDLYIGDLWYESLPDFCTTESDGTHTLYDYFDDPTIHTGVPCVDAQPYYFSDLHKGPYNHYGPGQDNYEWTVHLPTGAIPLQFKLYYGPQSQGLMVNDKQFTPQEVYNAFPRHHGTFVNIPEPSRWMPLNDNPAFVQPYLRDGANTFKFTVSAEKPWEERPFDLWARFRIPSP